jgi:hypothetical protein
MLRYGTVAHTSCEVVGFPTSIEKLPPCHAAPAFRVGGLRRGDQSGFAGSDDAHGAKSLDDEELVALHG